MLQLGEHLYLGTPQSNMDDMEKAGTRCRGEKHPFFGLKGPAHPRAKYDQGMRDRAIKMMAAGWRFSRLSKEIGVSRDTLSKWWREHEVVVVRPQESLACM